MLLKMKKNKTLSLGKGMDYLGDFNIRKDFRAKEGPMIRDCAGARRHVD